jgi:tetratricopeptide (TPR) repeat protein
MKKLISCLLILFTPLSGFAKKDKPVEAPIEEQLKFKEGDEKGNDLKALKTELLVENSEKRALLQLQKLLEKHRGRKLEPDILYRLGELYMRRGRTERFFEIHKNNKDIMNFLPTQVKDASEKTQIRKAIVIYEDLQARFPEYRNLDAIMFNEAYAEQQLADDKAAEKIFKKLISKYPDSPLLPDAFLSLGEIFYQRKQFDVALQNFKEVRKYSESRVYPYSIYKGAWCYYNVQNAQAGLKELEAVVDYGAKVVELKLDAKLDLRKEALSDMTLFYSDVGSSQNAVEYFLKQARELDPAPMLIRLSDLYDRSAKYSDIELLLTQFIQKLPDNELVANAREHLIWNNEHLKLRKKAVEQMSALNKLCQERTLAQEKLTKVKVTERTDCQEKVTEASKKLAQRWHAIWKKKVQEPDLLASAEVAYQIYLQNFDAKDTEQHQLRLSYGELLFQEEKFREASAQYASVNQFKPDAKIGHDASYAAIVSLEKATQNKWSDPDEKRFTELAGVYLTKYPKSEFALDIEFKKYFIAYEKKRYDEAAVGFKKIGWTDKDKKLSPEKVLKAQDLYLDILNIKKDYKNLKEAANILLKDSTDSARVVIVEKIYREAYFSEIQGFEESGDTQKAIESYKKFAMEQKKSELAPKAWWNASQLEFKTGDVLAGANTCTEMSTLFRDSPQVKDCVMKAAATFESLARLDLAAKALIELAQLDPKAENRWRELAADFLVLSGAREKGLAIYAKLAETRKEAKEKTALIEKQIDIQKLQNNSKAVLELTKQMTSTGQEPESSRFLVEQAEEKFEQGDFTTAFNLSKKIIGRESLPKNLLARARFVQAEVLDDEFKHQSVKSRIEKVATVLALKTEKLEKAQKAYQSAIQYNDPDISVKAIHKLASCYLNYSQALRTIQLTGEVSDVDKAAFQKEIDNLVVPLEEKGIDNLNQALQAAKKFHSFDQSVVEIQKELNKLNLKTELLPTGPIQNPPVYLPKRSMKFGGLAILGGN